MIMQVSRCKNNEFISTFLPQWLESHKIHISSNNINLLIYFPLTYLFYCIPKILRIILSMHDRLDDSY